MTTLEGLQKVRELLSDESQWCQRALARDKDGFPMLPEEQGAVQYCLNGAVRKVAGDADVSDPIAEALERAARVMGYLSVGFSSPHVRLTNETDHPTVLKCIDLAIEMESKP